MGNSRTNQRDEIILGTQLCNAQTLGGMCNMTGKYENYSVEGVIRADGLKALLGTFAQAGWTGPFYPNKSSVFSTCFDTGTRKSECVLHCEPACFFNVTEDPGERHDLSAVLSKEEREDMINRIERAQKSAFTPNRGTSSKKACQMALGRYHGFYGPFVR